MSLLFCPTISNLDLLYLLRRERGISGYRFARGEIKLLGDGGGNENHKFYIGKTATGLPHLDG